jgi:hypothetical protein
LGGGIKLNRPADEAGMKGPPTHNLLVIHTHNSLRVTWRSRKSRGGGGIERGGGDWLFSFTSSAAL